jgi:hypothetical protein
MKRIALLYFCLIPFFLGAFAYPVHKPITNKSETQTLAPITAPRLEDFNNDCDPDSIRLTSFSPNRDWEAIQCERDSQQVLDIANKDGRNTVLLFTDYLDLKYGIPLGNLAPAIWTPDGKSLYFSSYVAIDGGGVCFYGFGYSGLWKIDMETRKISTVLPIQSKQEGYFFAFSPDRRYLAYIRNQPAVRDLDTGIDYKLSVKGDTSANLTWSTVGENLYFVSCTISTALQGEKDTVLYKYSLSGKKLSMVFMDNGYLSIESFDGDKKLIVRSESPEGTKMIEIDPVTGKSQVITRVP